MLFREGRQIAICIAALAMVCGFVLFRYLPMKGRIKSLRQNYEAQMSAISESSAKSQQLPTIRKQLLQLQTTVGNYERQIPEQRELGEFLQRIAGLMNEHNLQEQMIQPGKELKVRELNCIPVNMQCKGRLSQIFEFYRHLQELDRLVRIKQVKLINDRDFSGEVTMQTEAIIYYRKIVGQG